MSAIIEEINAAMQKGKAKQVKQLIPQALEEGIPAQEILEKGLLDAMSVVGEKFKNNEVFVPEVLVAARAMNAGTALLKPYLSTDAGESKGKACIGTVEGDLHDIGKNIVRAMLEASGFEVVDLGIDVKPADIVKTAKEQNINIIGLSGVLTLAIDAMKATVEAFKEAGMRDQVHIIIGGAPVSADVCKLVGADAWAVNPADTIKTCRGWAKEG